MSNCGYAYHTQDVAALGYCAACVAKTKTEEDNGWWISSPYAAPSEKKCECGAQATINPNMHAFYCPCWRKQ